jgi:molybdopterin molybdotransferase
MKIEIELTQEPITGQGEMPAEFSGAGGAFVEFSGVVRDTENGQKIAAIEYEAYSPMAENKLRQIVEELAEIFPCLAVRVIHRIGVIPAGETAIHVGITGKHRGEAFALLTEFMNRLKVDVPIWKCRVLTEPVPPAPVPSAPAKNSLSVEAARAEIAARCQSLPGGRVPLSQCAGRTLREDVTAPEDSPATDRSTRDGYALLLADASESFQIVDTLHAADWRPRELKTGEAVRVATGSSLPGEGLRVVMQEDVEAVGDRIRIVEREAATNVRRRGEEMRAGATVLPSGTILNAGRLALLASIGCVSPFVSPRLNVVHFTTGDEVVPPDQKPKPGQIRDSNSILMRTLLQPYSCDVFQQHLPEDFEQAKAQLQERQPNLGCVPVLLVSGGASVGTKDFTRQLLEHLGFEIVFSRLNLRPGAPLIFGVGRGSDGHRIAFGLPGNPLSHFVCHHLFVAAALARLTGAPVQELESGTLATDLDDASDARDTFWPALVELEKGRVRLTPLPWRSSGDLTCLVRANALLRVLAGSADLRAGAGVEYLPVKN